MFVSAESRWSLFRYVAAFASVVVLACGAPTAPSECEGVVDGTWSGSGLTLTMQDESGYRCLRPGFGTVGGAWSGMSATGPIVGSLVLTPGLDSLELDLNPSVSACVLDAPGFGPRFFGRFAGPDSLVGYVDGGYLAFPSTGDCSMASDTLVNFEMVAVTLLR